MTSTRQVGEAWSFDHDLDYAVLAPPGVAGAVRIRISAPSDVWVPASDLDKVSRERDEAVRLLRSQPSVEEIKAIIEAEVTGDYPGILNGAEEAARQIIARYGREPG